jgi:hypothetical protein
MNNPAKKSVDKPNSLRSLMSWSRVYMLLEGASSIKMRAKTIITAKIGWRMVSIKVFLAIVSNLMNK